MKSTTLLILLMYTLTLCKSGKILYIFPFASKSHYIAQKDLPLELARRGHEVYAITPYIEQNMPSNYHQLLVEPKSIWTTLFTSKPNIFSMLDYSMPKFQGLMYKSGYLTSEQFFNSTDVQKLLTEDHKFDVVINELFVQESLYFFAHKYQAPHVLVTTFGNSFKANYFSRNPLQLATVYHEYGQSLSPLSFFGRLNNLYLCLYDLIYHKFIYMPRQEQYALQNIKDLPQPVPSIEELAANVTLVLMNSHFSIDVPTAYLPNFIEVGGLSYPAVSKSLPEDLQKVFDNAKHGVVYLNFGSNVPSSDLSPDRLQAFLKVFGELKQTVVMKWESDELPELPKNVVVRKWFPQKDILAHPKVKLFICHGGLIGLLEAISVGVPIIGVPVFSDQMINVLHAVESGYGEILEYKNINEENIRFLVNKVLSNKSYMDNAKAVSRRFKDRPMNGLVTAVWWIEYVIRHQGADFIKSPALKMSFMEYNMIDVYGFIVAAVAIVMFIVFKLLTRLFKKKQTVTTKKQKKH